MLFLVGDFNMPDINWHNLTSNSPTSRQFCDLVFALNLSQLVLNPTHVLGGILDLVITNPPELIENLSVDSN